MERYLSYDRAHFADKLRKVSLSNEAKSHALPGTTNTNTNKTNINNNRRQSYLFPSGHIGKPSLGGNLSHLFFPQSTNWEHTSGQRRLSSAHTNNIDISQLQLVYIKFSNFTSNWAKNNYLGVWVYLPGALVKGSKSGLCCCLSPLSASLLQHTTHTHTHG